MSHYFSEDKDTPSDRREITCRYNGVNFYLETDSDVFSKRMVDFGTDLLIKTAISNMKDRGIRDGRLLDLGCGYGVIGIVLQRVFHHIRVTLADINQKALDLSRKNAANNYTSHVDIVCSNGWGQIEECFDVVLTNPPVRAGKKVVFDFYKGAFEHLRPGGLLYVVLQKKQGAPSSVSFLEDLFGSCEILEKKSGYWIFCAEK